jgi:DnaJ family protein C protein 13
MPTYQLEDAKKFCIDLLDYLGSHAQYLYSLLMNPSSSSSSSSSSTDKNESYKLKLKNIESALEALRNVIRHNDGVEVQCIGHFKLLFMLLRLSSSPIIQSVSLELLISVTANQSCVNDIANVDVLVNLLLVLHSFTTGQQLAIDCLYALSSNSKIVKDMVATGGLLYCLHIFANGSLPNIRQKAAELLAKLLSEKLTGPRIRLILQRFLPPLFMDAMKDNPEAAVNTYEGTHENPELIWNDESRSKVGEAIRRMADSLYAKQAQPNGSECKWTILEDLSEAGVRDVKEATSTLYSSFSAENELVVSGVFIRLFILNPGWVLRKPREFLVDLFEIWSDVCNRKEQEGEHLEQLTQAIVQLFIVQPLLMDNLPPMGVLPQIIQALSSRKDSIVGSGLQVVNQVAGNDNCLRTLSSSECMHPMKQAMIKRPDLITVAADALSKIFSNQIVVDEFVGQVSYLKTMDIGFCGWIFSISFALIIGFAM